MLRKHKCIIDFFFCVLKSNLISEQFVFWFIWKHDMWCDNMKRCRTLLIWCFWACHRCSICLSERDSLFILIRCDSLMYFTVWVHEAILMLMFFLTAVKTCTLCDAVLLFFWISWNVELCTINIHKIVNDCNCIFWECIYFCRWNHNICWLCNDFLKLYRLIISEVLINLLTQDSKFVQDFWHFLNHKLSMNLIRDHMSQCDNLSWFISVQFIY